MAFISSPSLLCTFFALKWGYGSYQFVFPGGWTVWSGSNPRPQDLQWCETECCTERKNINTLLRVILPRSQLLPIATRTVSVRLSVSQSVRLCTTDYIAAKRCKTCLWCVWKSNRNVASRYRMAPFSPPPCRRLDSNHKRKPRFGGYNLTLEYWPNSST